MNKLPSIKGFQDVESVKKAYALANALDQEDYKYVHDTLNSADKFTFSETVEEMFKYYAPNNDITLESREGLGAFQNFPYRKGKEPYSLGDQVGRIPLNKQNLRLVFDAYNIENLASAVGDDNLMNESFSIEDFLKTVITSDLYPLKRYTTLHVDNGLLDDSKGEMIEAVEHIENILYKNRENHDIFKILREAKQSTLVTEAELCDLINDRVAPETKLNGVIFVNSKGFKLLDGVDACGMPLMYKRDGKFIYRGKYEVVQVSDIALPSTETQTPLLFIDTSIIYIFAKTRSIMSDDVGFAHDFMTFSQIVEEYILLSTTSDQAYLNCHMAI